MEGWNYEKHLNEQIKKIKHLKSKGYSDRDIIDRNEFCYEALNYCGLPLSYLIPQADGCDMALQEWDTHTSVEHKWEYYNESPFGNTHERDRVLIGLLYSMGLKHLLKILPQESKEELFKVVNDYKNKEHI